MIIRKKGQEMKVIIELDMHDEIDRTHYADFLFMERNAVFWNRIYEEVFRKHIKYGDDIKSDIFHQVWDELLEWREQLRLDSELD